MTASAPLLLRLCSGNKSPASQGRVRPSGSEALGTGPGHAAFTAGLRVAAAVLFILTKPHFYFYFFKCCGCSFGLGKIPGQGSKPHLRPRLYPVAHSAGPGRELAAPQ